MCVSRSEPPLTLHRCLQPVVGPEPWAVLWKQAASGVALCPARFLVWRFHPLAFLFLKNKQNARFQSAFAFPPSSKRFWQQVFCRSLLVPLRSVRNCFIRACVQDREGPLGVGSAAVCYFKTRDGRPFPLLTLHLLPLHVEFSGSLLGYSPSFLWISLCLARTHWHSIAFPPDAACLHVTGGPQSSACFWSLLLFWQIFMGGRVGGSSAELK
ncbi:hypothetical protein Celaphus_00002939 [Cervus elaphus hippelaphus]|uniref:Uncharacterized protein n=1 Tax=Cervus elaphus hippelaphus TaxID=46360 RepID=A0A212D1Y0_CEREH|nr:hypothetical protein Celaphus_00002939 [Cervus elaphus hippelaphus]